MPNPKLNADISVNLAHQNRIKIHDCTYNGVQENADSDLTRPFQLFTSLK